MAVFGPDLIRLLWVEHLEGEQRQSGELFNTIALWIPAPEVHANRLDFGLALA